MAKRTTTFDRILARGIREKKIPALTKDSREWYRNKAKKARQYRKDYINMAESWRKKKGIQMGKCYFFAYDPKWKKELPYYDAIPLIFPFNYSNGLIYAINLHHAPPKYRAAIMDALYALRTNNNFDESTKLRMSWSILSRFAKAKEIKPIVRTYLPEHVRSEFIEVHPSEWDIVLFLPIADYRKKSAQGVYADYRKKLQKGK